MVVGSGINGEVSVERTVVWRVRVRTEEFRVPIVADRKGSHPNAP